MTMSLYILIEQKLSDFQYRILFSNYLLISFFWVDVFMFFIGCKFLFYLEKYLEEVSNVRFWDPKRACPPMKLESPPTTLYHGQNYEPSLYNVIMHISRMHIG